MTGRVERSVYNRALSQCDSTRREVARLTDENKQLRTDLAELASWHAECDKVGIPYDPPGLVRHHRNNASMATGFAMYARQLSLERERDDLRARAQAVRDLPRHTHRYDSQPSGWWMDAADVLAAIGDGDEQ